jgi:GNAT superfamily N-acetyltransferase
VPTDPPIIRRGVPTESDRVADLIFRVREQNVGSIPPGLHPMLDMRTWMSRVVFPRYDVWVADSAGRLVATLVLGKPDWIEHLYVDATHTGRGLGSHLVDLAKAELSGQVQLWTFQSNAGARRFYERHGFRAAQTTEGDNEEQAPDIRYVYTPSAGAAAATW